MDLEKAKEIVKGQFGNPEHIEAVNTVSVPEEPR